VGAGTMAKSDHHLNEYLSPLVLLAEKTLAFGRKLTTNFTWSL
jgi:hypothetical protein